MLLDHFDSRFFKGFTQAEAEELVYLVNKDNVIARLIASYQQNPAGLSAEEERFLAQALYFITDGDLEKAQAILTVPMTSKMDDGRVGDAYARARQ